MTRVADYLELVRAPAALTVLGDAVVGAVSAAGANGRRDATGANTRRDPARTAERRDATTSLPPLRTAALAGSSVCLYSAGMALNDYADAELDAQERPERPIPSGRISRERALATGAVLTAAGVGAAFAAGRASGLVSLALAGALWSYDLVFKATPAGPAVMALCRGLDVLLGAAGPGWRGALLPAAAVAVHTAAVTAVSRGEVSGTTTIIGRSAVVASTAVAASGVLGRSARAAALLGGARYLAAVLPGQLAVAREPGATQARDATRAGIRAIVPLQSALTARAGAPVATAALLAVETIGRLLGRRRTRGDIT